MCMELFHGNKHAFGLDQLITHHMTLIDRDSLGELAIIQLGENASSAKYVALKLALCSKLGIKASKYDISSTLSIDDVFSKVSTICNSPNVKSVIIQLPLPSIIDKAILNLIPIEKDIDLLSDKAQKRFYSSDFTMLSPIIRAIDYFLGFYKFDALSMSIDVVGKGFLVGSPLAYYLKHLGADVRSFDEHDDISKMVFKSDLVIAAAGKPKLINGNMLYHGTSAIDFGSTVVNNKIVGDIDVDSGLDHLQAFAPSPGGLGPLVVRYLLVNHLGF